MHGIDKGREGIALTANRLGRAHELEEPKLPAMGDDRREHAVRSRRLCLSRAGLIEIGLEHRFGFDLPVALNLFRLLAAHERDRGKSNTDQ